MHKAQIENILKEGLNFLLDYGFELIQIESCESEASGIYHTICYKSEFHRRSVNLTYFPALDIARASIADLDQYFAFGDAGSLSITEPQYDDMEVSQELKLINYLKVLKQCVLSKYIGILTGDKFENDPFDWSPYK